MYRLGRTLAGPATADAGDMALAALFALSMLIPLVWAVTLPDLPEIYTRVWRARRWFRQGRCTRCGYVLEPSSPARCPECGQMQTPPGEYAINARTIYRFIALNLAAWIIGCAVGECLIIAART